MPRPLRELRHTGFFSCTVWNPSSSLLTSSFGTLGMAGEDGRGESLPGADGGVPPTLPASFALHPPPLFANDPGLNLGVALGLSARGGVVATVRFGIELAGAVRLHGSDPLVGRSEASVEVRSTRAFSAARAFECASASSSRCNCWRAFSAAAARSSSRCLRWATTFSSSSRFLAAAASVAAASSARTRSTSAIRSAGTKSI